MHQAHVNVYIVAGKGVIELATPPPPPPRIMRPQAEKTKKWSISDVGREGEERREEEHFRARQSAWN